MQPGLKSVSTPADAAAQARVDLAACYRLAAHFGLNEGIDNHLTLLVPDHSDRFLLAPFGLHWSAVRAASLRAAVLPGACGAGAGTGTVHREGPAPHSGAGCEGNGGSVPERHHGGRPRSRRTALRGLEAHAGSQLAGLRELNSDFIA